MIPFLHRSLVPQFSRCLTIVLLALCLPCAQGNVIYVDASQTGGAQDGSSWQNAFSDLQQAIAAAVYGDTLWVAKGTYRPTASSLRGVSFVLKNGVRMFGGFQGTETALGERDWTANQSVLSGDIGALGDSTDNSYTVILCAQADSTTRLDGFFIEEGNADDPNSLPTLPGRSGGGMHISGQSQTEDTRPVLANCVFRRNRAFNNGGGVYVRSQNSGGCSPFFDHCSFEENIASNGGGIYLRGGSKFNQTRIEETVFIENMGLVFGGGFYFDNNFGEYGILVEGCIFKKNLTSLGGSGIYHDITGSSQELEVSGSIFENNNATGASEGTAINYSNFFADTKGKISNCLFKENKGNSGTISIFQPINQVIENCIFYNNEFSQSSGIAVDFNLGLKLTNSIFISQKNNEPFQSILTIADFPSNKNENYIVNCLFYDNLLNNPNFSNSYLFNVYSKNKTNFLNSIFSKNGPTNDTLFLMQDGGQFVFSNNIVDWDDCSDVVGGSHTCGPGMLYNLDPLFLDTAAGDFRLHPCSPARNAGDNGPVAALGLSADLGGGPRILGGTVDMGPYEVPDFAVTGVTVAQPACHGGTATATVTTEGGCGPFTLEFAGSSSVRDSAAFTVSGLTPGTTAFALTDASGRTDSFSVTVAAPPLLDPGLSAVPVDCAAGTPGSASATPGGGTPPLSLSWWDGGTDPVRTGLPTGTYAVTLTDANGCTTVAEAAVTATGLLALSLDTVPIPCHPDNGPATGELTASATGVPPLAWLWDNGHDGPNLPMLGPGAYALTVTDALGCTGTASGELTLPTPIIASAMPGPLVCPGLSDGTATVTASGGTPPLGFLWDDGQIGPDASGLPPGTYPVTVTDTNGCTASATAIIAAAAPVTLDTALVNATGAGFSDGSVATSNHQGGTPPYSFLWSDGQTGPVATGLPPGDHTLTVTDSAGCATVFVFTVGIGVGAWESLGIAARAFPNPVATSGTVHLSLRGTLPAGGAVARFLDASGRQAGPALLLPPGPATSLQLAAPAVPGTYWLWLRLADGRGVAWKWEVVR